MKTYLDELADYLVSAEQDHPDLFHRAFPHGDGGFIDRFKLVMEQDWARKNAQSIVTVPAARHDARHDAESIYWVFLYAFARARPLGSHSRACKSFFRDMLFEDLGSRSAEPLRERWMHASMFKAGLFARELERLEMLFMQMATYLYIPWHLYCDEGRPMAGLRTHVHIAFRRLILWFKLDPANAVVLRVALDTAAPRYTSAFDGDDDYARQFAMPAGEGEETGASNCSDETAGPSTSDARAPCGQKRKAETEAAAVTGEDDRASKKPRASAEGASARAGGVTAGNFDEAAQDIPNRTALTIVGDANDPIPPTSDADVSMAPQAGNSLVKQRKERKPQPDSEERYDPALHRDCLSAKALRLMFAKDKELWFGCGKYTDP